MSAATKYTLLNLPNTFTVFSAQVTDSTTRGLVNQLQSKYNTFGATGLYKQMLKLIQKARHPAIWNGGKDKEAILSLWSRINWGQLDSARRTALFTVTNGIS